MSPVDPSCDAGHLTSICRIVYCVFLMHRRKDLWGPDGKRLKSIVCTHLTTTLLFLADLFDPDRFLDERLHKYLTPNPFIFLPFNAGPRICLGQQVRYDPHSHTGRVGDDGCSLRTTKYPTSSFGFCSRSIPSHWTSKRNVFPRQIGPRQRDEKHWRRSY